MPSAILSAKLDLRAGVGIRPDALLHPIWEFLFAEVGHGCRRVGAAFSCQRRLARAGVLGRNGRMLEVQLAGLFRLWAAVAAWRRLVTPSLRRMLETWTLAVFSLM